jgi:hypothetical protein
LRAHDPLDRLEAALGGLFDDLVVAYRDSMYPECGTGASGERRCHALGGAEPSEYIEALWATRRYKREVRPWHRGEQMEPGDRPAARRLVTVASRRVPTAIR